MSPLPARPLVPLACPAPAPQAQASPFSMAPRHAGGRVPAGGAGPCVAGSRRSAAGGRPRLLLAALLGSALLWGCAAPDQAGRSMIPAQLGEQTSKEGAFAQPVKWTHVKPGCTGECPRLVVDSLAFPGRPALTALVDHALATMTWLDDEASPPYATIAELEPWYWQTAGPRDEIWLQARNRYRNAAVTVVELNASQYRTGMAHGVSGVQLLNWNNAADKPIALDDMLRPGARPAFEQALRQAHARWLQTSPAAQQDPLNYGRLWPFQPTDNVGLSDTGLVAQYQSYEIAPYASGHPELLIPYAELQGILQPQYLPAP